MAARLRLDHAQQGVYRNSRRGEMLLPNTGVGAVDSPEKTFLDVQGSGLRQHFSDVAMEEDAYWLSNTSMADRVQGYQSG
ncbi:uncharacterized protein B0T23DRAFT_432620 [Neurospora hispaniola]|uniref:Uncharacterized protein n=1 Tax=Neurospora hispaniola TaxID=588809 RepID=A0AAJ0MME5_9PEZI|nr:hypothetical protein B0T23DRAFT_432620 [Neurospora hispaniola]